MEVSVAALASDSDQDDVRRYIDLVCSTYKREETCEYSFGFVFFPSGLATHSYATRLAGLTRRFGLSSPAAYQRPAAALREAPPNSDDSEGNDLTT